jgi:hypothetical protein
MTKATDGLTTRVTEDQTEAMNAGLMETDLQEITKVAVMDVLNSMDNNVRVPTITKVADMVTDHRTEETMVIKEDMVIRVATVTKAVTAVRMVITIREATEARVVMAIITIPLMETVLPIIITTMDTIVPIIVRNVRILMEEPAELIRQHLQAKAVPIAMLQVFANVVRA